MRRIFSLLLLAPLAFVGLTSSIHSQEKPPKSGCIECHTNEAKIQSLYIPPKQGFKVEAGEG